MSNHIDIAAVLFAESMAAGIPGADRALQTVMQGVGLSREAHTHILATIGERKYLDVITRAA